MKKIGIVVGILLATIASGLVLYAKRNQMQRELAEKVFRFHVLANSNSEEDQELKLKVKGEILDYMKQELPESDSVETTKKWAKAHLQEIEEVGQEVIQSEGYEYPIRAYVTTCAFPDKTYGDVTFPAGKYEALRIEIGEAEGENWWCVLYPNLCFFDSIHAVVPQKGKDELKEVLEEDTYRMVTTTTRFRIKWFFFKR